MTFARPDHISDLDTLPRMPAWITSARAETLEDVAFLSGAALNHLHLVVGREDVPQVLLQGAAGPAGGGGLRGACGPSRTGRGAARCSGVPAARRCARPAGEAFLSWQRAVERLVSVQALHRALPSLAPEQVATWLDAGQGGPSCGLRRC